MRAQEGYSLEVWGGSRGKEECAFPEMGGLWWGVGTGGTGSLVFAVSQMAQW